MSFRVEIDKLREFACLVDRYANYADYLKKAVETETEMSAHEEGLLGYLFNTHEVITAEAVDRADLMNSIGYTSQSELQQTAEWYELSDEKAVAELDAAYEVPYPEGGRGMPMSDDHEVSFDDLYEPFPMCIDLTDASGILDKGDTVTQWASNIGNWASKGSWVGKYVKEITGVNPFEWVAQWFSGDWNQFAHCALAWEACAKAVTEMEANLDGATPTALSCVWEGKAADSAMDYFHKLCQATTVESEFYEGLFQKYKELMEASYYAQQTVQGYFTQLYDTILDACTMDPKKIGEDEPSTRRRHHRTRRVHNHGSRPGDKHIQNHQRAAEGARPAGGPGNTVASHRRRNAAYLRTFPLVRASQTYWKATELPSWTQSHGSATRALDG